MGNGLSADTAYLPSLQGWQAGHFTGGAQFSYPLDLPVGPGGLKPEVVLSYSSDSTDGPTAAQEKYQAGWVGRGWSLDPAGSISRNVVGGIWDTFTLTAIGRSFDVVRGKSLLADDVIPDITNLGHFEWNIVDEAYWRIRWNSNNSWTAWSPDGMRFDFTMPLKWASTIEGTQTYKWLLTQMTDPSGNKIVYTHQLGTVPYFSHLHYGSYLSSIAWGYDGNNIARYRLDFQVSERGAAPVGNVDKDWDYANDQVGGQPGTPHEAWRLNTVSFVARPDQNFQHVKRWSLTYEAESNSLTTDDSAGQRVLTLKSVQHQAFQTNDGVTGTWIGLPATTFTYGMSRGTAAPQPPTPGWNRLLTAENGYGGRVRFTYGHIWTPDGANGSVVLPFGEGYFEGSPYAYRFRVTQMLQEDIINRSYSKGVLTTYSYGLPALNTAGHSAAWWYASYIPGMHRNMSAYLAHPLKSQFRGHEHVITQVYDGRTTSDPLLSRRQTWFYQGKYLPSACTPKKDYKLVPEANEYQEELDVDDPCYKTMVQHEAWKGRVYKEEVQNASGTALSRVTHQFDRVALQFYEGGSGGPYDFRASGLWRAFNYEWQTVETLVQGGTTSNRTVETYYKLDCTLGVENYGNVRCQKEYNQQGLVRTTQHGYIALDVAGGAYIVNRNHVTTVSNANGVYLAHNQRFYDGQNQTLGAIGAEGLLTRQIQVSNVGGVTAATLNNMTLYGVDSTYSYDTFGQVTQARSYNGPGWVKLVNNSWTASTPGNGSTARTTTTTYGANFPALPVSETNAADLITAAAYDYRLGTLVKVVGPNSVGNTFDCLNHIRTNAVLPLTGDITCAGYDAFGRLIRVIRTGDSAAYPTLKATYYDTAKPFRYEIEQLEQAGNAQRRVTQHLYDGMGRQIQTKQESNGEAQTIVTDIGYDGLGRVVQQSQPRYVAETSTTFYTYAEPSATASVMRWANTTYDGLGRVSTVTTYDPTGPGGGRTTNHTYALTSDTQAGWLSEHQVTDANNHSQETHSDSLGRLIKVVEIGGTDATTRYAYNPLDLLTNVIDAANNQITISYDSLGRKTAMSDPDMGNWSYEYWGDSTLKRQTAPTGISTCFYYDAINRPTGRHFRTNTSCAATIPSTTDVSYSYDEAASSYGKGRRTSMVTASGNSTRWQYDTRGRVSQVSHVVANVSGARTFNYIYDSADRLYKMTYPTVGGKPRSSDL
ncbi:hypothetical protein HC891_17125 [Candidatus Gracilibacteria bacterium]|nr:hypothetical protein [Candidatus Gracilibacteria bacterium]